MQFFDGQTVFKKNGAELTEVPVNEAFKDVKMTAYYFGAKWCDDCIKFSPLLRDFYNDAKDNDESFEVIYVSSDKTEDEMRDFVSEFHPDWYVFYASEEKDTSDSFQLVWEVRNYLDIKGIPNLVVMKENNICATMNGVTDLLEKGPQTLAYWKKNSVDQEEAVKPIQRTAENKGKIIPNCCSISKFKPWANTSPVDLMANKKLMRKVDNTFKSEDTKESLSDKEIVAFYFSAHWCPPCRHFTPLLKNCYDEFVEKKQPYEVVFISYDETEEELEKYMLEAHGDWLVVKPQDEIAKRQLSNSFAVDGIPVLAIVNKKGEILSRDATRDIEIKGVEAFSRWAQGQKAVTEEELDAYYK